VKIMEIKDNQEEINENFHLKNEIKDYFDNFNKNEKE
jgi:hypothetical protein